ncbi:hypothetical protein Tco_1338920 [Tanacetum coccineum]
MTHSTVKRLTKPLNEPEREFQRLRRAACRLQQNEFLAIAGRNLFDDEASSSKDTGTKPPTPPKTLHEHSHPNSSGFQNPIILPAKQTGRIVDSHDILLIQGTCTFQGLRSKDLLRHVKHYLMHEHSVYFNRPSSSFFDPESVIPNRRRNLGDPSLLLDFEEINMNPNRVQGPPPAGPNIPDPDICPMEELLQAPTNGVGDAIVVPPVLASRFELKNLEILSQLGTI